MAFPESLGIDFFCDDDIAEDLAFEDDPVRAFAQACYRRLTMGPLFYVVGGYGPSLFQFLLETDVTDADIRSAIITSLSRDDRVASTIVDFIGGEIRVSVKAHGSPDNAFTLAIDRVSAKLISLEVA